MFSWLTAVGTTGLNSEGFTLKGTLQSSQYVQPVCITLPYIL